MTAFPQNYDKAVVFDLEFTAWEGSMANRWSRPGEFTELVQIGAVMVDARTFAVEAEMELLVRPRLNAVLSDYFMRLTGISNEAIRTEGVDFTEAYRRFLGFTDGRMTLAFGTDNLIFEDNIRLYGIADLPPPPPFKNLRPWFDASGIATSRLHSCDVGPLLGVQFQGRKHNALDDAKSLAAGIGVMLERGARNPLLP